jgi:hypothetical protein
MAAVVRVKRRLDEEPVETLVLLCKRAKTDTVPRAPLATEESSDEIKSVFKFAGTLTAQDKTVTNCVTQAIKKVKLQKQYREHYKTVGGPGRTEKLRSVASDARYKVVSERRAVDEEGLWQDGDIADDAVSHLQPQSSCETNGIFCLCDLEKLNHQESTSTAMATGSDVIMCNNVPMVRETVALPTVGKSSNSAATSGDDRYVYDVYYANDAQFDFRSLEKVLAVEAFSDENAEYMYDETESDEDAAAYDEDDENAENNWRNDYPEDDPMYFERLQLDDNYDSDDEYGADKWYGGEYDDDAGGNADN